MNILLLGSGGREHALAWKISQSPLLSKLYIAPGNPGTQDFGENINISPNDFEQVKQTVIKLGISMVVVGPEDPLVNGIHDFFLSDNELKNIPVIGPTKKGAMLEGSKDFSKGFMIRHGIPTARYQSFKAQHKHEAMRFLSELKSPYVLKADGLAAGKGVVICQSLSEAEENLNHFFDGAFGEAGKTVIIEEFLHGIEVSVFVLTDGKSYVILPEAKDYKRIGDGDTGLNTGGMGAVSPVPFFDSIFRLKVEECIVKPTIKGLAGEGIDYKGFIFVGIMNVNGEPYVIEYNARMGDPETQAVMPRLKTDILELFVQTANQELHNAKVEFYDNTTAAVIVVSEGYPGVYKKGVEVSFANSNSHAITFHAGTAIGPNGKLVTSGGRVMASVGIEKDLRGALKTAYSNAQEITYDGKYYRTDIGKDLLKNQLP
ncbi:MAG: phosphoribosylamine--glycine ligase [Bacteroidales bacterium]|nr:phosphoribosylamine--glycine ligase [Bacteroidales bacterium]MDD4384170.1 phosphoribosylamine--glycine ligase [Bacteroidales bacterium]MDY0197796.1 phosphoribosylamine--glycine ligase [Tenuifilaceae bacterium]